MEQLVSWGFPYLIGRVYLDDLDALRDLAQAIAIGGLSTSPSACSRSDSVQCWRDGSTGWVTGRASVTAAIVPRYSYHGLELGMWMTNASLIGYMLWSSGTIKTIRGISFGWLLLALMVTTVLCKSTGALALLVFGMTLLWVARRFKWPLLVWLVIAISPTYCVTRAFDIWSGREAVEISRATVGEDRAESLQYRLNMESMLADRGLERPIFGWGRFNRSQIINATGDADAVPDGYWIITLGVQGLVGLACLLALMLLPMALTLRRFPVTTWCDPKVGPVVGLALMMVLAMLDYLSNAMLMPIYRWWSGG